MKWILVVSGKKHSVWNNARCVFDSIIQVTQSVTVTVTQCHQPWFSIISLCGTSSKASAAATERSSNQHMQQQAMSETQQVGAGMTPSTHYILLLQSPTT